MAHELGHFLGLDEAGVNPSQATIMNNPSVTPGLTTCQNASAPTNTVQMNDANKSGQCISDVRPAPTPTPTPECTIELCEAGCAYSCAFGYCVGSGCASPIIVDVAGDGFELTDVEHGVMFDIEGDGVKEHLSWTSPRSDEAFLVLDRNGNGIFDDGNELFGNYSPQPRPPAGETRNGFLALVEYDKPENGGNHNGRIDELDGIVTMLRLWKDSNQDGVSQPPELHGLDHAGIKSINLNYKESRRVDTFGNRFRYRAKIVDVSGTKTARWAWDVFLLRAP
jgi:hypothetical protein